MSKPHQGGVRTTVTDGQESDFVEVRQQIASLDLAITGLRETAERLLESAAGRTSLALLEPVEPLEQEQRGTSGDTSVWPRLGTSETQRDHLNLGLATAATDDGAFGAPVIPSASEAPVGATVLEFAPRQLTNEADMDLPTASADTVELAAPEMPADWNTVGHDDDAAIEKFFSAEVEPEPAQRWLLND